MAATAPASESMQCNACNFTVTSATQRSLHYKSEWHRYNVKRQCAGLGSIAADLFEEKLAALQSKRDAVSGAGEKKYKCVSCKSTFASESAFKVHLTSKKHLKREKHGSSASSAAPSRAASAPPSPSLAPSSTTPAVPALTTPTSASATATATVAVTSSTPSTPVPTPAVTSETKEIKETKEPKIEGKEVKRGTDEKTAEEKGEEKKKRAADGEEDGEGDAEGDDTEMKGEPIPLKSCLFCNHAPFENLQPCLDHMLKIHGFFIPFVEYLTDLNGLIEYLGAKVGEGHVCLYCNGRGRAYYPSLHAVREHMNAKQHCKIRFEEDDEDDEFIDFFQFPGTASVEEGEGDAEGDEETKTKTSDSSSSSSTTRPATAPKTRGAASIDESGELVLTDGSRVGHRSMVAVYRQKVRPTDSRESVLIAKMMNSYKLLALPGYSQKEKHSERSARISQMVMKQQIRFGSRTFMKVGRTSIRQQIGIPKKKKTV